MDDQTTAVVKDEAYWLKLVQSAYSGSTTYFDAYIRPEIEKSIKQFQSKFSPDSKYMTDAYRLKSKVFRPKTRTTVRKHEAVAASAFFSTEDVTSIRPVDDNNPIHLAAADIYKYLLQERLTKSIPWFVTLCGAYQEAMVSKCVASIQYWKYDEAKGIDKPCVDLIPTENLRIDPSADWTDPINSSPYVIRQIPMYVKDVRARINKGKWFNVSDKELLTARTSLNDSTRMVREGRADSKESATGIDAYTVVWVHENYIEDDGVDLVFHTLGTTRLLSNPVPLAEVYHHNVRPIVMGHCMIEPHKVYSTAPVELYRGVQDEMNDVANTRLENVKLVLNKRYLAKRNKNVDLRSLTRNVSGSVTMVTDLDDIKVIDTGDVTGSSYQEQDRLNLDFDDVAGGFSGSSVASNRNLNETVGGMNILTTQANMVGEYQLRTFTETWVEPVLRQLILLERAYETDEMVLQLAGQSAQLEAVTEEMMQQEVVLTVNVGIGNTNPQNQVERFIFGLNSLKNLLGEDAVKMLQVKEVTKELFGKLGYRDGSRFFEFDKGPDPIQQEMQQLTIDKLKAEIEEIKGRSAAKQVEAMVRRVETLYSAMQAAQTAATIPGVVPIADEIARSAGFVDQNAAPLYPSPAPPAVAAAQAMPDMPVNTSPMFPARPEGPGEGMMHGIETQRNDGVIIDGNNEVPQ